MKKMWCKFPKRQKTHHVFQQLRALGTGRRPDFAFEQTLDRCNPVNRGAN
jgi:hypothetical protein